MTLTRITVDEKGKAREESIPEKVVQETEEQRAQRRRDYMEKARRHPHGALGPRATPEQANHPRPKMTDEERAEAMEKAGIRENAEGGQTQGRENPEVDNPEEQPPVETEEEPTESTKKKAAGKKSGTDSSAKGKGDQDTPEDEEE